MRKGIALCLTLCLACVFTIGCAVTYTLPEKLSRQLLIGSGLKGSFVLNTEGSGEAADILSLFNKAEIQVRGMASDKDWHYYLYQTDENENQWARTDLYGKDGAVYIKSQLLADGAILMIPAAGTAADLLTQKEGGNPSAASAILNLIQMSEGTKTEVWQPLVQQLEERLETWLTPYALEPAMRQTEDGQTVIDLSYVIPTAAMKECILAGMKLITGNEELMTLAGDIATEEQQEVYLNPYLQYYYGEALDRLNLQFDVTMTRTVSTLGKTLSSSIELPLDEEKTGYSSLTLATEGDTQRYTVSRADRRLTVIWPSGSLKEDGRFSFWTTDTRSDGESSSALRFDLTRKQDAWEDDEARSHETYDYTLDITRDATVIGEGENEADYEQTAPRHGEASLHFYSKYAQSSPTTLEISVKWQTEGLELTLNGKIKSASPWVFSPFEITNPQNMLEMTTEELLGRGAEWAAEAAKQIIPNAPEETPEPTPAPTPEPAEAYAAEDEEEAEPSETPAPEPEPEEIPAAEETDETNGDAEDTENADGTGDGGEEENEEDDEDEETGDAIEEVDTSDWPDITASPDSDG